MTDVIETPTADTALVSSNRLTADNTTLLQELGLLADLAGTWVGHGFNLIARPDFRDKANLYLQLNQTDETTTITPVGSAIPNRGFGQGDIELFGLSYLQKISDQSTGGALHIEPGMWVTQPATTYPPEQAPAGDQLIYRLGSIPHGNALLAAGTAERFSGPPALQAGGSPYAFSLFPSFNSTPFGAGPPLVLNAAGSSEAQTAPKLTPPAVPFGEYNLAIPSGPGNPRTPFNTTPPDPPLPTAVDGVAMQDVVNDPIRLLQAQIEQQVAEGFTFEGVALNIATQSSVTFLQKMDDPGGSTTTVNVPAGAGGIENTLFLDGEVDKGAAAPNAQTSLVYATFWIEQVTPRNGRPFMQLQYAQMSVLDFPIFALLNPPPGTAPTVVNLGWPHVSVATLTKSFG